MMQQSIQAHFFDIKLTFKYIGTNKNQPKEFEICPVASWILGRGYATVTRPLLRLTRIYFLP
jgi:hypothetical protein